VNGRSCRLRKRFLLHYSPLEYYAQLRCSLLLRDAVVPAETQEGSKRDAPFLRKHDLPKHENAADSGQEKDIHKK
jgi:hypothetical protein